VVTSLGWILVLSSPGEKFSIFLEVVVITDEPLYKGKYCFSMSGDLATLSDFQFSFFHQNLYCSAELPYKDRYSSYTYSCLATLPVNWKFAIFKEKSHL
jgi:hypothetical protein